MILDTGRSGDVWTVAFHPDGKHLLSGDNDGIRRWRLADGQEVGKQTGIDRVYAISVSRNGKWIVCGTEKGASVWDRELHEKIIHVEGENQSVWGVDVSSDSTWFATGTDLTVSIWSITSGTQLVGPLEHDSDVTGIRFSPTGERVASTCVGNYIRIFESRTGDKLVAIGIDIPRVMGTPLAWSSDGQQIFATSSDKIIRSFNTSTGSQLAESQTLHDDDDDVHSIALAANRNFIATATPQLILFLDTATLTQIGPAVEDDTNMWSTTISPDGNHLVNGRDDGKFVIHDLRKILSDVYAFNVSISSVLDVPHSITHPDKQCRYLFVRRCRNNLRNPADSSPKDATKVAMISSRYQSVFFPPEPSSHDGIG